MIALSLLVWPLGTRVVGMAVVLPPWALDCFASNSAHQARLGLAAPALAPALMALNTSAIYGGQAVGASIGGWLIAHEGFGPLHGFGFAWLTLAIGLSVWAGRRRAVSA